MRRGALTFIVKMLKDAFLSRFDWRVGRGGGGGAGDRIGV